MEKKYEVADSIVENDTITIVMTKDEVLVRKNQYVLMRIQRRGQYPEVKRCDVEIKLTEYI